MTQRYQYQNFQPITSYGSNTPMTNTALRNTNYPNVIINRQRMQNANNNTKYPDMHVNHPIYEGLDPNITNYNVSSSSNYDGIQFSNATEIDPNFFTSNDYDNAAAPASRTPATINRPVNSFKSPYVNGNGSAMANMTTKFDRSLSFKTNPLSPSAISQPSPTVIQNSNSFNFLKLESIRKSCFASKTLYQDPEFPPNERSLYPARKANFPVVWMRPGEIVNTFNQTHGKNFRPEMVVRGYELCDLNQGSLGDCWVVAALACMTCHDYERTNMLSKLIPPNQGFRTGLYFGAFMFRFWRNGEWVEIIIDDLLPTKDGRLIYISSNQPNEFWGALIEKAYAKLNGSYEALDAGQLADALDDFTGGMTEYYSLDPSSINGPNKGLLANIDDQLIKAYERHSLITAGILNKLGQGAIKTVTGTIMPNGLVAGHAYTISDIRKIKLTDNSKMQSIVTLIRVRNPWGNEIEWNGAWSDQSSEWLSISETDKKLVGLVKKADGEFWISMNDFFNNFDTLDICHLPLNQNIRGIKMKNHWNNLSFYGEWKIGVSSGGRPKLINSHFMNPQFRIDLKDSIDAKCSVIIGLLQEDPRGAEPKIASRGNLSIGFVVYQLKSKDTPIPLRREYFASNSFIASVDSFINSREVVKRFSFLPGSYLIVPCTYDVNQEGRFLLRVFTESVNNTIQSTEIIPISNQLEQRIEPQKEIIVRQMFYRESGNEMALTAFQLQRLINWFLKDGGFKYELNIEACKAIVVLFDQSTSKSDHCFKFVEEHFLSMWGWLLRCLKQIQSADLIGPVALQKSLESLQMNVSSHNIQNLIHKFCNESGTISVSGFITIVALISKTNESFDFLQRNNSVSLTREEYLSIATKI